MSPPEYQRLSGLSRASSLSTDSPMSIVSRDEFNELASKYEEGQAEILGMLNALHQQHKIESMKNVIRKEKLEASPCDDFDVAHFHDFLQEEIPRIVKFQCRTHAPFLCELRLVYALLICSVHSLLI